MLCYNNIINASDAVAVRARMYKDGPTTVRHDSIIITY